MTLPHESYWAVVKTSEFLKEIMSDNKMSKEKIRKQARDLLKHYPFDFDVELWIKNNEKVMCEWAKPKARTQGYIAIGRHDPVEYSPKHGGWIFWQETWADFHGPFVDEESCQAALLEYCKELESGVKPAKVEKTEEEKRQEELLKTNAFSPPELKEMVAKVKKSLAKKKKARAK